VGIYRRNFSGDSGALLSGIMLGARADFSEEMKLAMQGSGTTHLVALSGYNIAVLMLAISYALGRFLKRNLTFWLTTIAIILFVLMVGAGASVTRAALMGFLALLSGRVGRAYDFRNAAILAAVLMVLYDPRVLRFDLGFGLSFAALLGITLISPALKKLFGWTKENFSEIKEQALTTFSAELAVMPLIVFNFSYFSIFGVLANILILWLVPLLMFLGFIFGLLALISEPLGFAISWLMQIILFYMLAVIKFFGKFSLPLALNFWIFGLIYILAISSIFYFAYAKKRL
jgi:competence protein ComEC